MAWGVFLRTVLVWHITWSVNSLTHMFGYRNRKYIGSYMAVLGHVDAIVFTAGIGENDPVSRELSCRGLSALGVELDHERNQSPERGPRDIGASGSRVRVLVIPTNEELMIARKTRAIVEQGRSVVG